MFQRILVPVDGSEASDAAITAALHLARDAGGRVCTLHVLNALAHIATYDYDGDVLRLDRQESKRMLAQADSRADEANVPHESRLVEVAGRSLGQAVANEARAYQADLVVVGTGLRGRPFGTLTSSALQVVRRSPVPVLIVR